MRSDSDSWDIESSVGATALGVTVLRAVETARPDTVCPDPFAARLVRAVGSSSWDGLLDTGIAALAEVADEAEAQAFNPLLSFMTARTCYFDDYFRAAVAAGIRQFVVLAAGLDARAYRLQELSGSTLFEVDLPKVLEFKASALAADRPVADRRAVAADLREDWPEALRDNGFEPDEPTAWLAEGLLRYLPAAGQDLLFERIVAVSAPGSRVALNTWHSPSPVAAEQSRRRVAQLAGQGIELDVDKLLYPEEGRAQPADWFARHGWQVRLGDPIEVLTGRGRDVPAAAVAEMARHTLLTAIRPGGDSTP
ncbi:SAM-dependent methyltransferase [Nocardia goodfellowii]|uniref:S-adenosyl-L-methionine-dependent methyltransferase n=1 Tax=Nocardia goodfellowii TaxID=882446 RepID=A0ABS4QP36_9NOCA|nr:class I SAM-dependent methyltransferase [Nocardia goodfellowii]MBP2193471.1 methyltransferase (TIGR00027 family) [Nocardia goodfellowii]